MKLQPPPLSAVTIGDTFWSERRRVNRDVTLAAEYQQCESTGRIDALSLAPVPDQHYFWDSDVAKWLEAAAYSLETNPDPKVEKLVDETISLLAAAQQPDGYLNSYFTTVAPEQRWVNLRDHHELYCAGHLIEAGVAHHAATGKTTLLDVVRRYADYIGTVFGTGPNQRRGYCGHEEIELALVKLAEATGDPKYRDLAKYFVDERGRPPHCFDAEALARGDDPADFHHKTYEYNQAHEPVREQTRVTGHAVRGMYLYAAMADLAATETDGTLKRACENIWDHLTTRQMYVTGGVGGFASNEGYGADFDLPNLTAYAETCAAVGLVFWAARMANLDCDSRYADVMEQALYNGVLSGVSRDGTRFFYDNPLASMGTHHRQDWFGCACCPPNIARLLASLGAYVYGQSETDLAVHLYVQGSAELSVAGQAVTLTQTTESPWDGRVSLQVAPERAASFRLRLRLPAWCKSPTVALNGEALTLIVERGYAVLEREWRPGDTVMLDLPMTPQRVYADPRVQANRGRVALRRGPIVYCLESADNGPDLDALTLPREAEITAQFEPDLLGGVVVLRGTARRPSSDTKSVLYRTEPPRSEPTAITAIPYSAWDNRAPGEMLVWIRE